MPKVSQDTAMGLAIVVVCLMLVVRENWFLTESGHGQRLVRRFGMDRAVWILRGCLLAFALLGGALALGLVQPIRW